jgi:hypothetical protein
MYIHKSTCISPQQTYSDVDLEKLNISVNNMLNVVEPKYDDIPLNVLRRMGKAVRMGVGAALPLIKDSKNIDGIIIGTANGGMEDCIKFLNQIVQFEEGRLTPTNFVQSTPNAIAAQIGITNQNKCYNITHVHRGLAFENALIDAQMLLRENLEFNLLVGGVDEISSYNYNIENLGGWFKDEEIDNTKLYKNETKGTIAGEGVTMFVVNNCKENSIANISAIKTLHTNNTEEVAEQLKLFIEKNISPDKNIDLFLTGENGDNRLQNYYNVCENIFDNNTSIARFKHYCGEYPTASAFSVWLASKILNNQIIPQHFIKCKSNSNKLERILIYNNYKGQQHSFMLIEK